MRDGLLPRLPESRARSRYEPHVSDETLETRHTQHECGLQYQLFICRDGMWDIDAQPFPSMPIFWSSAA